MTEARLGLRHSLQCLDTTRRQLFRQHVGVRAVEEADAANGEEWKLEPRLGDHCFSFCSPLGAVHNQFFACTFIYSSGRGQRCHLLTESNSHRHLRQWNAIWSHVGRGILLKDTLTNGVREPGTETLTAVAVKFKPLS